jgi:Rps23 Pro-64 3,4-dihydroxylase Tpa1-like proline 4-hydroxylase
MIVIQDALPLDVAERLRSAFLTAEYTPQMQRKPDYYGHGQDDMPVSGEDYLCSYGRAHALEKEALFRDAGLALGRVLSSVGFIDKKMTLYAYRMRAGDHFRVHDDRSNGIGFIYYLCKEWKWDWGGLLMVAENGMTPVLPRFNQLAVINNHATPHFVSQVAPHAREPRYALVGFMDGPAASRAEQTQAPS